jgi:uncharacterized protein (DUF2147 family)
MFDKWFGLCVAVALACFSTGAAASGKWLTTEGKSHVEIVPSGDQLCGTIVWLREPTNADGTVKLDVENEKEGLRGRPIVGLPLLNGFKAQGAENWNRSKIYNPEDGKIYKSKMNLADENTLKVKGCVLFFYKTQTWTRVE